MSRQVAFVVLMLSFANLAGAQDASTGLLTCHHEVCPLPSSTCQTLASKKCVKGECPGFVNVADGTFCNDGNACTVNDVCTSGVCGGTEVTCSSPTDVCSPSTGTCGTPCGTGGCTVDAANGFLNPTLTVPPGALPSSVSITMADTGGDPNDPTVFHVYTLGPDGTDFATPATLDLPAPPLSPNQSALIETSSDGVTWSPIQTSLSNGRVTAPISHFSVISCHTRAYTPVANNTLNVTDSVDYEDVANAINSNGLVIPGPGETGSCPGFTGDFGLCFRVENPTTIASLAGSQNNTTFSSATVTIALWQCYAPAASPYPGPFDPTQPQVYEYQHCSDQGFILPCPQAPALPPQITINFPNGGLAPGQSTWVPIDFNTSDPSGTLAGCLGSSWIGADVLFREPSATDPQGGMRSAIEGPLILSNNQEKTWEQLYGCAPTLTPYSTCPLANYPVLKQNTTTGVPVKNWLEDTLQ